MVDQVKRTKTENPDPFKCIICGEKAAYIQMGPGSTVFNGKPVPGSLCADHVNGWGNDV
jgi:hypothetical protein